MSHAVVVVHWSHHWCLLHVVTHLMWVVSLVIKSNRSRKPILKSFVVNIETLFTSFDFAGNMVAAVDDKGTSSVEAFVASFLCCRLVAVHNETMKNDTHFYLRLKKVWKFLAAAARSLTGWYVYCPYWDDPMNYFPLRSFHFHLVDFLTSVSTGRCHAKVSFGVLSLEKLHRGSVDVQEEQSL
jgi:hypothetical protein